MVFILGIFYLLNDAQPAGQKYETTPDSNCKQQGRHYT